MSNRITSLFKIQYPIIQAGMIWCSGWKLAAAVSNAGGLGIIGAGSMYPEVLREHIRKIKLATDKPFAVNVPFLYPNIEEIMQLLVAEGVKIVFTSAGNPALWTGFLKAQHMTVVHVVSNTKFALKAEASGVDAIVAEGFEAGGHNGREETTTMCLIPMVADAVKIPVIAAGGISSGRSMLAAMALGADGVQVGSAFAVAEESSAHPAFKQRVIGAAEGDTKLRMQKLFPVRLLKNSFEGLIAAAEAEGADAETLKGLLGRAKAKLGMFEGNLEEGELEIGQVSALLKEVKPAAAILDEIWQGFLTEKNRVSQFNY
ncbi:enoyl-[acyl-carrier protein] reductase II [Pedobacter cryoconitis]|uniref:Enoyl-[acyl-carrier protein] reductase II n=1 Tax=Pedobacter cryoconitis TaxID=188932 RepID=A0A7W8ZM41_9SPHI|nr:nitronate monooxygenase [Pedobacter cryoconitis]MBB5636556.1 enoyl-[acyl-carrier protein] reductase II [Pedobacter cryoconitis]MBB6271498.1 enoyl-[acyl-carrier protein] reductase II [Pedobacter cryoconitis]